MWDRLVRVGHWSLAASVAVAWFTRDDAGRLHEWAGYAALLLAALRVGWGFAGPRRARFADFVRGPASTLRYARLLLQGREPRHLGHNPLGGWMIVALLAATWLAGLTGWLYTTDAYWGDPLVEDLHEALASLLPVLAGLHVAGVVLASRRHRENLAAAMVHGRKRAPGGDDVA